MKRFSHFFIGIGVFLYLSFHWVIARPENTPWRRDIAGAFRYGLEENQAQVESEVLFCREAVSVIPLPVVSARNGDSHLRPDPVFQVDPGLEGIHPLGCFRTHILDMEETGIRSDYDP